MNAPAKTEEFAVKIPDGVYAETVLSVEHFTDHLFRFRMTSRQCPSQKGRLLQLQDNSFMYD